MAFHKNKNMHIKNTNNDFLGLIASALMLVQSIVCPGYFVEVDFSSNYGLRVSIRSMPGRRVSLPFPGHDRPNLPQRKDS